MVGMSLLAAASIFMAGDSTMCNYSDKQYPQQGWGQQLPNFTVKGVEVKNKAIGGRSSKSFINEGRWQSILDESKPGDFVVIQFGHNDAAKQKPERHCTKEEYKENYRRFIREARAKGLKPVLATSIIHIGGMTENPDGTTSVRASAAGVGTYVDATREIGAEMKVPVVDLNSYAKEKFEKLGAEKVRKLYLCIKAGEYDRFTQDHNDRCHTRDAGANFYARGFVTLAKKQRLEIARLFKDPRKVLFRPIPKSGPKGVKGSDQNALDDGEEPYIPGED